MQTITTNLYSFKELSKDAKERAIEVLIKEAQDDRFLMDYVSDEMLDSLKAVCESCGLQLVDWSFGSYSQNWRVTVRDFDYPSGPRALAWFLKVLVEHGYSRPKHFKNMEFPGVYGFTGVCYDDDVVETVWKELLDGETVAQAFDKVAYRFCKMLEDELAYRTSEECIMDYLDKSEECWTGDGERY